MHRSDIISLCSMLVGIASAVSIPGFGDNLDAISGGHGKTLLSIIAVLGVVGAQVIRVLSNPAAPVGQQYVVTDKDVKPVTAASLTPIEQAKGNNP